MSLAKSSLVLAVLLLACAVTATNASAEVQTKASQWYTGASPGTTLVGEAAVVTKIAEHPSLGAKISISLNLFGEPARMTATGINCIGCKLENKEVTGKAGKVAFGRGKLEFTGVTVDEPAGCTVSSELGVASTILTKELTIHGDWMDANAANQKAFLQLTPPGSTFFQFKLAGSGLTCESVAGAWNTPGSPFAESTNNTGVFAAKQNLTFGEAVQTTTGGGLGVGDVLTGTFTLSLASGAQFAIK